MNRQEFLAQTHLCARLRELLNEQAIALAMALVIKEMAPRDPDIRNGDLIQQAAINGMKYKGAHEFLNRLENLTLVKSDIQRPTGSDYDKAAVDSLVASGIYTQEEAEKAVKESLHQPEPTT